MQSDRVGVVLVSNEHWIAAELPESSALAGTQSSCGSQSGSGTGWSAAAHDQVQAAEDSEQE